MVRFEKPWDKASITHPNSFCFDTMWLFFLGVKRNRKSSLWLFLFLQVSSLTLYLLEWEWNRERERERERERVYFRLQGMHTSDARSLCTHFLQFSLSLSLSPIEAKSVKHAGVNNLEQVFRFFRQRDWEWVAEQWDYTGTGRSLKTLLISDRCKTVS